MPAIVRSRKPVDRLPAIAPSRNGGDSCFRFALFLLGASLYAQPGPVGRPEVDPAAAARGKKTYLQYCINCHGSLAQGTDQGPDLVRSVVVLRDKLGAGLGTSDRKSVV